MRYTLWLALPLLLAASLGASGSLARPSDDGAHKIARLDARFDKLVPRDAKLEIVSSGHEWTEGPVWDRKNERLLFSDIPRNAIYEWRPGSKEATIFLKPSGYTGAAPFEGREPGSNGLAFDGTGRLVLCEHGDRRVARLEKDGKKTTIADRYEGKRLNSPNDLAIRPNGDVYFTDPAFGLPKTFADPAREIDFCGVYRVTKEGKVALVTKEIEIPNGIAFSPDGKRLYVSNVDEAHAGWYAFDVKPDGTVANKRLFHDAREFLKAMPGASDGMKVDEAGNLFASGPGGIYVFAPDGAHLGTIVTGGRVSNCGWGEDGRTLYITADSEVFRIRLSTKGAGM
jgi:gluconolactonase